MAFFRSLGRIAQFLWRTLGVLRSLVLNLVFLLLVAVVAVAFWQPAEPLVSAQALVLRPSGELVEQSNMDASLELLTSSEVSQTRLRDLLEAISAARTDERIKMLVIETDDLTQAGLSKLAELRTAIERFKTSGKPVYARGERFNQGQYYLASAADEVHLSPDGFVLLRGLARYVTYYKNALDKLGIDVHVFRVGEYKSFSEPFTRTDMSEEDRLSSKDLLDALWNTLRDGVIASRGMTQEALESYVNQYGTALTAAQGNAAQAAMSASLVDRLSTRDEWEAFLKEKLGSDKAGALQSVDLHRYLAVVRSLRLPASDKVAVLVAQGGIIDGESRAGSVGGDDFSRLIRAAREDAKVKAVVVRIDSPGGSAWASEQIRRELEVTRNAGKPVVISMSSVAASGGYWIAAAGNEIWAHPATVTGSIGIFALIPNFTKPFNQLGMTVDGVSTGPFAGAFDPRRPVDPEVSAAMQQGVEYGYRRFIDIVSNARKMPAVEVDGIARGHVWIGEAASKLGLVDNLGGLEQAIASAAKLAGVSNYEVSWPERDLSMQQRLFKRLTGFLSWAGMAPPAQLTTGKVSSFTRLFGDIQQDIQSLQQWNDPQNLYTHCLCESP